MACPATQTRTSLEQGEYLTKSTARTIGRVWGQSTNENLFAPRFQLLWHRALCVDLHATSAVVSGARGRKQGASSNCAQKIMTYLSAVQNVCFETHPLCHFLVDVRENAKPSGLSCAPVCHNCLRFITELLTDRRQEAGNHGFARFWSSVNQFKITGWQTMPLTTSASAP